MTSGAPPRYVSLQRQFTILMFDRASFNPASSIQVSQVGDIGMVHSLIGPGFYELLADVGLRPFREQGVRTVYAAVSPAHLRLLQRRLTNVSVEQHGICRINNREIPWIRITDTSADS